MMDRRTFTYNVIAALLAFGLPSHSGIASSLSIKEPRIENYSERHSYEVRGSVKYGIEIPISGTIMLSEQVKDAKYYFRVEGALIAQVAYVLNPKIRILIESRGSVVDGFFRPHESFLYVSPSIFPETIIRIEYFYEPKPFVKFHYKDARAVEIDTANIIDDMGSAYLNYRRGNFDGINPLRLWMISKLKKREPSEKKITAFQSYARNHIHVNTRDLHTVFPYISNAPAKVRMSLDRVIEEAEISVWARPIKIRKK